jgi:thioredoxin reductase (NADPH)
MKGKTPTETFDCVIVGAGPAGLVAAIYLARFRRSVLVIADGTSRARHIPRSHNIPGFPEGIPGPDILRRLRQQAKDAGVAMRKDRVDQLSQVPNGFKVGIGATHVLAATVILATGSSDHRPIPGLSSKMTWDGKVRWCPICDGYESMDRRIVLVADSAHGSGHALFIRTYTSDLTLVVVPGGVPMAGPDRRQLSLAGIRMIEDSPVKVVVGADEGVLKLSGGESLPFDVLYPMTGSHGRSSLARTLHARFTRSGDLRVDAHQQTSVKGLYAAGDIGSSLKQISVAFSEGAKAATAIHRSLPPNFR